MNTEEMKNIESDLIFVNRFITHIGAMRSRQVAYKRDKRDADYSLSKALEAQVDNSYSEVVKACSRILTAHNNERQ